MEMARLGVSPTVPLAVQQWNGLIAVNYPARAFGITRHETPAEALKKCPELVMVHCATYREGDTEPGYWDSAKPETHKISLDHYRRESLKIIQVFNEFCPVVQKASIDESYLDLTLPVRKALLERFPALGELGESGDLDQVVKSPREMGVRVVRGKVGEGEEVEKGEGTREDAGMEMDWKVVGGWVPKPKSTTPPPPPPPSEPTEEAVSSKDPPASASNPPPATPTATSPLGLPLPEEPPEDQDFGDPTLTWSDVALYLGAEIVMKCRKEVHERLGYTCSAGIAINKMLAKLCSGYKKPNAQTLLRPSSIDAFLTPLPFQKIRNLGGKLGHSIKELYDVVTVAELQEKSLEELQKSLGEENGMWLWDIVRGRDWTEVELKTRVKSMLSSKNFKPSLVKYSEAQHWIGILSTELHLRLVEARELSPGLWPKTITFQHRSESYSTKAHQCPFPFTSLLSIAYIQKFASKLLHISLGEKTQQGTIGPDTRVGPWGNLALSFSGLERGEEGQKGIEGFFLAGVSGPAEWQKAKKRVKDEEEAEEPEKKKKSRTSLFPLKDERSRSKTPTPLVVVEEQRADSPSPGFPTYTCPRCSKTLAIPPEAVRGVDSSSDNIKSLLKKVEDEHVDYHFARDMLEEERRREHHGVGSAVGTVNANGNGPGAAAATGKKKVKKKQKVAEEEEEKPKAKLKGQQSLQGFFTKR